MNDSQGWNFSQVFVRYQKKSKSEIDFILKDNFTWKIYPIEVKSGSKENIPIIFKSFQEDFKNEIWNFYVINNDIIKKRKLEKNDVYIISYLTIFSNFLKNFKKLSK